MNAAAAVLDHNQDVEAAQEDGVDVGEVDREHRVSLRVKNCRQLGPDRWGAGSPAAFKIFHTGEAATWWPSPTSSPWMRR